MAHFRAANVCAAVVQVERPPLGLDTCCEACDLVWDTKGKWWSAIRALVPNAHLPRASVPAVFVAQGEEVFCIRDRVGRPKCVQLVLLYASLLQAV